MCDEHRGFESHPLRHSTGPASLAPSAPRRGRLVAYGAALEMRFGETRRGFESPPLRHSLGLTDAAARLTIAAAVLGGELAVPCTRNPLQRD